MLHYFTPRRTTAGASVSLSYLAAILLAVLSLGVAAPRARQSDAHIH